MPTTNASITHIVYPQLLKLAVAEGDLPLLRRLLQSKNLPPNVPDPENGWPMLFYAIAWHQNELLEFFLSNWSEASHLSKDFKDNTALMIAIEYGNITAFNLCLERYPDLISAMSKQGKTALTIATEKGHADMIQALLEQKADVNSVDGNGSTPLHHAAAYGHTECVDILLKHGANLHIVNKMGWKPFDYSFSFDLARKLEAMMTTA
ncbi:Target of rapamycin complex 2 subunit avo2 [Batrachochytrium dendrobatidis]|nr:Target of rapamycin complex 2 subunit avo2 [Batrachochytrium dendrobatidis]KAK5664896.1 Target of rapamycin complex 2 subunit avo2 [Batrachochytrium dendrobatidis]